MSQRDTSTDLKKPVPAVGRRNFLVAAGAVVIGAVVAIFPLLAGLAAFLDPLHRKRGEGKWFRVGTLDALEPEVPRRVAIIDDRDDAWTHHTNEPIGAVFLVAGPGKSSVEAFNTTCPHAGCSVGFQAAKSCFVCPCHTSAFDLVGKAISPVPPRDMDSLECEIRNSNEIWVKYQDFITGRPEKTPKA